MNRIKTRLANWFLKNLFNAVTEDEILKFDGKYRIADKEVPKAELQELSSGAAAMRQMLVWQYLAKDMKHEANKMIYDNSKNEDDLIFGKAVLYAIDLMEKKLKKLSEIK